MGDMQMVILASGLGTGMRPLTRELAKTLIPVDGKPFPQYQIELLKEQEIGEIVACIGHQGERVKDYVGGGSQFCVDISSPDTRRTLLGRSQECS